MKSIKSFLEKWGLHSFLLPVFFVLHNYKQYYGLVSGYVAIKVLIVLLLIFLVAFLVLLVFSRFADKSLQIITLFGAVFLFYGVVKDFFHATLNIPFISKYSVLLPIIGTVLTILTRHILRRINFRRSNFFQNVLLLIFILTDVAILLVFDNTSFLRQNLLSKNTRMSLDNFSQPLLRPNVYYLVFDCYPGTTFLKNYLQYDNSPFDTVLIQQGFHVVCNPKSNYNRTAFSLSSTLNFAYLKQITSSSPISAQDYNRALLTIRHSIVPNIFKHNNYTFYNLSIFNIGKHISIQKENFLKLPEANVLLYNTLLERVKKDLLWNFATKKTNFKFIQKLFKKSEANLISSMNLKRDFNNSIIDSLQQILLLGNDSPKFVYAHFYLPHPPFYYNEEGQENNVNYIVTDKGQKDRNLFLSYLKYTNKIISKLIERIQWAESGQAVILLQSDHGFTDFEGGPEDKQLFFKNYSAFYFPDKNYSSLYDTLSNVNTFPILFNKYFKMHIPLQADTSVFLSY